MSIAVELLPMPFELRAILAPYIPLHGTRHRPFFSIVSYAYIFIVEHPLRPLTDFAKAMARSCPSVRKVDGDNAMLNVVPVSDELE